MSNMRKKLISICTVIIVIIIILWTMMNDFDSEYFDDYKDDIVDALEGKKKFTNVQ